MIGGRFSFSARSCHVPPAKKRKRCNSLLFGLYSVFAFGIYLHYRPQFFYCRAISVSNGRRHCFWRLPFPFCAMLFRANFPPASAFPEDPLRGCIKKPRKGPWRPDPERVQLFIFWSGPLRVVSESLRSESPESFDPESRFKKSRFVLRVVESLQSCLIVVSESYKSRLKVVYSGSASYSF